MKPFKVVSPFEPAGDQAQAIETISSAIKRGEKYLTLKGVTGSGKTYTMAKVIEAIQKPALVISHNKTLSAQLYREFKEFFPENAVEYFVSYYDYYQPEAYVPSKDLYIEKDSDINEEIDRMRLSATASLMERRDVVIVATVSCIYGLGSPDLYREMRLYLDKGQIVDIDEIKRNLISLQYERNDMVLERGRFRIRGDVLEIFPAYLEEAYRIELDFDTIVRIRRLDPLTGEASNELEEAIIYPAKHFVMPEDLVQKAVDSIRNELEERYQFFNAHGKYLEAERIKSRTEYDIEMLSEMGYCSGIENYSAPLSNRKPGERPGVLLDYFPKDFICFIDESHVTLPQLGAMYNGDHSRKLSLVDYGFRLPCALDNRPLRIDEFESIVAQTIYVSATPGETELRRSKTLAEQVIRPTGLVDPEILVHPTEGQMEDIYARVRERARQGERSLIITLTKKMAEELTDYLSELGLRVRYIHSEVETIERVEILTQLRAGEFDVLVGINLLREGIDLPEVSFIAILDADKIGFLRSETSLIQIIGRAARNAAGLVVMYADVMSPAMKNAIMETERRRKMQQAYNLEHGITPRTISKKVQDILERHKQERIEASHGEIEMLRRTHNLLVPEQRRSLIKELEKLMFEHAKNLEFEQAALIRDEISKLKE
ncbi:MAG TPA: excinuclease ABC subunit UvrB [Rectinema sp.]|nr:excinuclease ABC subunit B [Spirochaetia bacterium]MDI9427829.1 excinuclease ABC subunit UvrB [Spirochaetota bacterium]NLH89774.1 excinuclease ABC subunit B [Treponema sp.]OQC74907.1 MAG: UvrABC system protein B [Spirochaetes bacterium ADurb.Bin001]HNP92269.1 excinuclease ABC subunit UvrB [Rectinema sp.]